MQQIYEVKVITLKKTVAEDGAKYVSGVNCTPQSAYTEFNNIKKLFEKNEGRQYYHFVQSFSVDENMSPQTANEIAWTKCFGHP